MFCVKWAHSRSFELDGEVMPLFVLPLSNMSLLKSPASMIWWLECFDVRVRIWSWIIMMRCISSK